MGPFGNHATVPVDYERDQTCADEADEHHDPGHEFRVCCVHQVEDQHEWCWNYVVDNEDEVLGKFVEIICQLAHNVVLDNAQPHLIRVVSKCTGSYSHVDFDELVSQVKGLPQPTILLKIQFPKNCLFESNKFITKREIYKDGFMKKLNKIFTFANNELFIGLKNTELRVF